MSLKTLTWRRVHEDYIRTVDEDYTVFRADRGEDAVVYLAWRGRTVRDRAAVLIGGYPTADDARTACEEDRDAQMGLPKRPESQRSGGGVPEGRGLRSGYVEARR